MKNLEKAIPFLRAVVNELDADRTNFVRCSVGDLGVEYEQEIRDALAEKETVDTVPAQD